LTVNPVGQHIQVLTNSIDQQTLDSSDWRLKMKVPTDYKPCISLRRLDTKPDYILIQTDYELSDWLDFVGFPRQWRRNITGIVLTVNDGDLTSMWLSESSAYYDLSATYHPLSYYRPVSWTKRNLPEYWLETNPDYSL
jgi:hypothetical protein